MKRFFSTKLWKHSFVYFLLPLLILTVILAVAGGGYLIYFRNFRKNPPPPPVSPLRNILRNGDVILRNGIGIWSEAIRNCNRHDKRFSHIGIVWIKPDGDISVIHSDTDDISGNGKVAVVSLEKFVFESTDIGVFRLRNGDPEKFVGSAGKYLGRPFDYKFNSDDPSEIYCTELVALALRETLPEAVLARYKNMILPEACIRSGYFTEIPLPATAIKVQ